MSRYHGKFYISNNTGSKIDWVQVEHTATEHGTVLTGSTLLEEGGKTTPAEFSAGATSTDHWKVRFLLEGELYIGRKDCAFDDEDKDKNVQVSLHSDHFNIDMPVSTPCLHISYD